MEAEERIFPRAWRGSLDVARPLLGLACLTAQLLSPRPEFAGVTILAILFVAYGAARLFWRRLDQGGAALFSLFFEAIFFLVFATYGADPGLWLSSVFYLYLMLSAVVNHDWSDVFIISGVCIGFFGLLQAPRIEPLRRLVLFSGLLACVLAIQRRKLQDRMADADQKAEQHRAEAEQARTAERQRIAADFHDGPLQSFIGFQVRLDILKRLLERDRAAALEELKQLQELSKQLVAELRSFLRTMLPQEVDGSDLVAYVRRLGEDFQKDTGIPARFVSSEAAITAPPETCQEILQILREALKNVQKHSNAGRVSVSLARAGKVLEIAVDDNGGGFGFSGTFTLDELELLRLGPQSIKRRIRSLGGELVIESRPGQGAGLRIRIPV